MRAVDVLGSVIGWLTSTFGGNRDLYRVLGYARELDYDKYLKRYARDDIAGRIVDIPAEATWEVLPRLTEDKDLKSETMLSKKFARLAEQIELRAALETLDILAGIGRYAVGLIGFNDSRKLDQPVDTDRANEVLFLAPFCEKHAAPAEIDLDTSSREFGKPLLWDIDFARGLEDMDPALRSFAGKARDLVATRGSKVHRSRLIHVAEGTLGGLYGRPRLRRVWNRLDDLAKIAGGSAEVFWMVANRGLQFDIDKDLDLNPEAEADLEEQIEQYRHGQSREFKTRGVNIKGLNELGAGNVNPRQVFAVIAALICGSTDIPWRMLFGTERGQGTNAQDQREWRTRVGTRRTTFANERMLKPFIRRVVEANALPQFATDAQLVWPSEHDDMHQAEVAETISRSVKNLADARAKGVTAITVEEFRSLWLGLQSQLPASAVQLPRLAPPASAPAAEPNRTEEMNGAAH